MEKLDDILLKQMGITKEEFTKRVELYKNECARKREICKQKGHLWEYINDLTCKGNVFEYSVCSRCKEFNKYLSREKSEKFREMLKKPTTI